MRLDGINGGHLFGYLASVGLLKLLDNLASDIGIPAPRLSFDPDGCACIDFRGAKLELVDIAFTRLQALKPLYTDRLRRIKKPGELSRSVLFDAIATGDREDLDSLSGLACIIGDDAEISSLCAANGAGHQNLIQAVRDILSLVGREHLEAAIFTPWKYEFSASAAVRKRLALKDRKPTLRFDPGDERLYGLRLTNPTQSDDFTTELGAQALAIPAFSVHPVLPRARPVTVGSRREGNRVYFHWALWSEPTSLRTVRSLQAAGIGREAESRSRGAFAAFRAPRVSGAKGKLSFAPTEGVW
jgi:hypothetical protein